jgi:hypothetical protein
LRTLTRLSSLGIFIALMLGGLSCSSDTPDGASPSGESSRLVNTGREGPLSVNAGAGSFSAAAPRASGRWNVTFGNFVLCSTEQDKDLVLDEIRIQTVPGRAPIRVVPTLRTFTIEEVEEATPQRRRDYAPVIGGLLGKPPFNEAYAADFGGAGTYSADIAGTRISEPCADTASAEGALNSGLTPAITFKELVFVVTTGPRGGTIRKAWVDYTADDTPRTLLIDWQMTACGTSVKALCGS